MNKLTLNTKDRIYPNTKNYYQKVFFRILFGRKLFKFFKVLKIVFFYKIGKSFEISDFLGKIIKNDYVIFDIGANLGQYALRFSKMLKRGGNVISIEPVYENYLYLNKIKKFFKLNNLVCCNYAISDTIQEGILNIPIINYDIELDTRATIDFDNYYFNYDKYSKQKVEIITLQALFEILKLNRLDIVKSDTEGNDSKVILGSLELIRKFKPIILVEESHKANWLIQVYNLGYLPFYVIKRYFLIDAFKCAEYTKNVKYDLVVLIHKTKLNDFEKIILS